MGRYTDIIQLIGAGLIVFALITLLFDFNINGRVQLDEPIKVELVGLACPTLPVKDGEK